MHPSGQPKAILNKVVLLYPDIAEWDYEMDGPLMVYVAKLIEEEVEAGEQEGDFTTSVAGDGGNGGNGGSRSRVVPIIFSNDSSEVPDVSQELVKLYSENVQNQELGFDVAREIQFDHLGQNQFDLDYLQL